MPTKLIAKHIEGFYEDWISLGELADALDLNPKEVLKKYGNHMTVATETTVHVGNVEILIGITNLVLSNSYVPIQWTKSVLKKVGLEDLLEEPKSKLPLDKL